jgi:hypothetical protein
MWPKLSGLFLTKTRNSRGFREKRCRKNWPKNRPLPQRRQAMEPMIVSDTSRHLGRINELVFELTAAPPVFKARKAWSTHFAIATTAISSREGHNTHPIDIKRALAEDFSADKTQRNLQLEAKAHIATQRWIDEGGFAGRATTAVVVLSDSSSVRGGAAWVENPKTGHRDAVVPGKLCTSCVQVGRHIAISLGTVPRFLARWEQSYSGLSKFETVLQAAAAHHRLPWIYPFSDGNGRVARLVSYAMLLEALDTGESGPLRGGLRVMSTSTRAVLPNAICHRRNDLDGRGTGLMPNSTRVLAQILTHRQLERKDVTEVVGFDDRKSRRVTAMRHKRRIITAPTHKAPFQIAFPAAAAPGLMPGLYPRIPSSS